MLENRQRKKVNQSPFLDGDGYTPAWRPAVMKGNEEQSSVLEPKSFRKTDRHRFTPKQA